MSLDNLEGLLVEQLQDIYYAEKQLVRALPRMARAASTPELQGAFTDHAAQTEEHVTRLEEAFAALGVVAKTRRCPAIEGLIQEAAEMMAEDGSPAVLDAGLIASAQRVEHYEIAAYGNARLFAAQLGHGEVAALLTITLSEERAADNLLADITTETVLPAALAENDEGESNDEQEDDRTDRPGQSAKAGKGTARRRAQRK
jgi:ferritin-like metal-binding protein YciE